jgi:hypothetical protein
MNVTGHRKYFEARCQERGIPIEEAMACVVAQDGDQWTIDTSHPSYPTGGAGEKLEQLLKWLLVRPGGDCKCQERARTMDLHGPQWVRENREVVCGWLRDAARKRHIPFFAPIAYTLIDKAVADWERELAAGSNQADADINRSDPRD